MEPNLPVHTNFSSMHRVTECRQVLTRQNNTKVGKLEIYEAV